MTSTKALAACVAVALGSGPATSSLAQGLGAERGPDRTYALGRGGWSLERFGADIAVLRTDVTRDPDGTGPPGLLVLSCDAGEHRWRLALPGRLHPRQASAGVATMLVQVPGPGGAYRVRRIGIAEGGTLALSETGASAEGLVPFFVRLLKAGTRRLDLLLRVRAAGPPAALTAYILSPAVRRTDLVAFDDFLAACAARPR